MGLMLIPACQVAYLTSVELPNIHGALVAVNELARVYRARKDYAHLSEVRALPTALNRH